MNTDLVVILGQFGPAGLMGLLWVLERRHAAMRERQLTEAHHRLADDEREIDTLVSVLRDNTRAIVTLEHTQRHLVRLAERLDARLHTLERGSRPLARPEVIARTGDAA